MGKKANAKKFRQLAMISPIPTFVENTIQKHIYTGKQLLEEVGYVPKDGEVINPNKTYTFNYPAQVYVNHARRMRRAFTSGGYEAVNKYVQSLATAMESREQEGIKAVPNE